jgi:hypothetical protein
MFNYDDIYPSGENNTRVGSKHAARVVASRMTRAYERRQI